MDRPLPLIVTPGDPKGIGPEVTGKALARFHRPVVLIGDASAIRPWFGSVRVLTEIPRPGEPAPTVSMIDPGDEGEPVEVAALRLAVMACLSGRARGIVTGMSSTAPSSKGGMNSRPKRDMRVSTRRATTIRQPSAPKSRTIRPQPGRSTHAAHRLASIAPPSTIRKIERTPTGTAPQTKITPVNKTIGQGWTSK